MRQLIRQLVRVEAVAVVVIAWLVGALGLGLATGAGAVPTAALMALGPLLGGLLLLIMHSLELARRIGNLSGESTRTLTTVRRVEAGIYKVESKIKQTFRQLETMQNLGAVLPGNDVLPATRLGSVAGPDRSAGRSGDIRTAVARGGMRQRRIHAVAGTGDAAVRHRRPDHRARSRPGFRLTTVLRCSHLESIAVWRRALAYEIEISLVRLLVHQEGRGVRVEGVLPNAMYPLPPHLSATVSGPAPGPGPWFTACLKGASSPADAGLAHCPGGLPCRHENRIPHRRERRSVREVQGGHLFYRHPVP